MFVVHLDTRLLHEVTFHVTSHEGSVIVSRATSLELSLTCLRKRETRTVKLKNMFICGQRSQQQMCDQKNQQC